MTKRKTAASPGYDWRFPSPVSDVDIAFPARALEIMPTREESETVLELLDPDVRRKFEALQQKWFFEGLPDTTAFIVRTHDGVKVDGETAFRHLKVIQGSYAPKHEHKVASFVHLASMWFQDYSLEGYGQDEEHALTCEHGNQVWFGHECGLCEMGDTSTPDASTPDA